MNKRKLTDTELANTWEQIRVTAWNIIRNTQAQGIKEFYKDMDTLRNLEKKIRWHEVAVTIEKGEQK